ncbi:hypothetical protein OF83DRAFT_1086219 [Amylostereum chailletii]|nr:hypothetical protein OF83DRAFT_1086219 [Amylostereum chailletii]
MCTYLSYVRTQRPWLRDAGGYVPIHGSMENCNMASRATSPELFSYDDNLVGDGGVKNRGRTDLLRHLQGTDSLVRVQDDINNTIQHCLLSMMVTDEEAMQLRSLSCVQYGKPPPAPLPPLSQVVDSNAEFQEPSTSAKRRNTELQDSHKTKRVKSGKPPVRPPRSYVGANQGDPPLMPLYFHLVTELEVRALDIFHIQSKNAHALQQWIHNIEALLQGSLAYVREAIHVSIYVWEHHGARPAPSKGSRGFTVDRAILCGPPYPTKPTPAGVLILEDICPRRVGPSLGELEVNLLTSKYPGTSQILAL